MRRMGQGPSSQNAVSRWGGAQRRRLVVTLCAGACVAIGMLATTATGGAGAASLPGTSTAGPLDYVALMKSVLSQNSTYLSGLPGGGTSTTPTSGTGGTSTTPTGGAAAALPGKMFSGTFTGAAGSLQYQGYVPSSYTPGTAVPLVVALHGCTQTADVFRQLTKWDQLAEAKGFIVVFPQQSSSNNNLECWNFFQTADMKRDAGEPSLIAGITKWVQSQYSVDPKRTYVNGLSAGGAMTSVMAATYPDLYAAAGIGSGCEYAAGAACAGYQGIDPASAGQQAYAAMGSHARPMPVIVFQGDKDTTVPPVNAQQIVQQWEVTNDLADDGVANGSIPTQPMSSTPSQVRGGRAYTVSTYADGHKAEMMQYWLIAGMGHAWSGGCSCESYSDPSGPDETAAMYGFFVNHPMP
jgi:poly(hydroxyalkanoate) depolymerase family esterase